MLKTFLKTAWRNLLKHKASSFINISGLAVGMAVALMIGLWVWDELSFNKSFKNYDRIAQVMQHQTFNNEVGTQQSIPYLTGEELRRNYGADFKNISMATWTSDHILAVGDKRISYSGNFMEPSIIDILSLELVKGGRAALEDAHSVIVSQSAAKALFGSAEPMDKIVQIDKKYDVKVTGVYKDLPYNSDFNNLGFIAAWQLHIDNTNWREKATNPWRNNSFQAYVQLSNNADFDNTSVKIRDIKLSKISAEDALHKPQVFVHPMSKWHLYNKFTNGVNDGGRIRFVWLFGIIGVFVLLLACINFMNLSTARSEKRAREVGVRKSIGSRRLQLILQFFSESLLITFAAFILALLLTQLSLNSFNGIADKRISIPFANLWFWILSMGFCTVTGIIAGSYPSLYLSSFNAVKVLKGTFKAGRLAVVPRRVLVVVQFTVSVLLIIGTIVVYQQIHYAKDRPVGYSREGLISTTVFTEEIHKHAEAVKADLLRTGMVDDLAESSSPTTALWEFDGGFEWPGATDKGDFGFVYISGNFGKTVVWHIKEGRDFSDQFPSDSSAFIINEAAAKFMNLKDPLGKIVQMDGKPFHIVGVVDDIVMESPYNAATRTIFTFSHNAESEVHIRLKPTANVHDALAAIEPVFKKYNPEQPFSYKFVDDEYAKKFREEVRIGKLSGIFAALAIFISCLGLFGLASFVAEQRTKEIGVRKVLGATVLSLWRLLSKEFVILVFISLLIAMPVAYYFMHNWLQNYNYRTELSWWVFAATAAGALLLTLITVSFQSIQAALTNPIKSLRKE